VLANAVREVFVVGHPSRTVVGASGVDEGDLRPAALTRI
jgi:hypothetical protein